MKTNQIIGISLLVLGVILLFLGFQSSQGIDDQLMETFTGRLTESTMLLFIAGGVSVVVGLGLMVFKR
jgi:uncharacterized protein YjeT (DUF2065 family)